MTDFNQKTHDTDVSSHVGQSRQMMEVFENQEFGSIRLLQEAGNWFIYKGDSWIMKDWCVKKIVTFENRNMEK